MSDNSSQISVSAIVVTYNSAENIISCLEALQSEVDSVGGEILVYDNHSNDNTVDLIKTEFPNITLYESKQNFGFGEANNKAVEKSKGEYILFANPDMVLDRGGLKVLLETFQEQPQVGAAVARLYNPDGSFQPTCRNFPDFYNIFFSRGSVLNHKVLPSKTEETYTLGDFDKITEIPAASAACMLMEKGFFKKIGGFDNRFFLFMEDTDLSLRIKQAGKKVFFEPKAGALHYWGK
ncbi:MAG: glycosyltransferase family 2 protein, partial [candidate division Zixibacteria bacterium]|nr:glycosyltransferase family 2 protein [candidate division Zixibacteria bacterium]